MGWGEVGRGALVKKKNGGRRGRAGAGDGG